MNHAMGSDQWFSLAAIIIFPIVCIYALATRSLWLSRSLAVVIVAYLGLDAINNGIVDQRRLELPWKTRTGR
jgi:hypothetical protein